MTQRRVVGVLRDRRGRIQALVNSAEDWSPVSVDRAIGQIVSGLHSYYTGSPSARRMVFVVNGPRGRYLRSAGDTEIENNLDNLPNEAEVAAGDVFVEISRAALQRALRTMHAAGSLRHKDVVVVEDHIVELNIGCHELGEMASSDTVATATVQVPVVAWLRRTDDPQDPGTSARGTLAARANCYIVLDISGELWLVTDWAQTPPEAVAVTGDDGEAERLTRLALLSWTKSSAGGRFPLRLDELGTLTAAALTFIADSTDVRTRFVADTDDRVPAGAAPVWDAGDWSVGMQAQLAERQIASAIGDYLGAIPPPYGPAEVRVSDDAVLTALDVDLRDGGIVISGAARNATGVAVSAVFTVDVSLADDGTGRLAATVESVNVSINEWYAQLADFFSAGAVRRMIVNTIRQLFSPNSGGLGALLKSSAARSIAALQTAAQVDLVIRKSATAVQRNGVVVSGELTTRPGRGPEAQLVAQPARPGAVLLHAMDSWSPGGRLVSAEFDFGDGGTENRSAANLSLVVAHAYSPGRYTATVRVTDAAGQVGVRRRTHRVD